VTTAVSAALLRAVATSPDSRGRILCLSS